MAVARDRSSGAKPMGATWGGASAMTGQSLGGRLGVAVGLAAIVLLSACADLDRLQSASAAAAPRASDAPSTSPDHAFSVIPQQPTGPEVEGKPLSDEFDDGTYRLVLTASQDRYRAGQLIDVTAAVTYLGPAETWLARGPESGLVGFSLDNDTHSIQVSGGFTSACTRYEFLRDVPLEFPFNKLSALGGDASAQPFYDDYMASDELRLPPGMWTITAAADIGTCGDELHGLGASIAIEVLP